MPSKSTPRRACQGLRLAARYRTSTLKASAKVSKRISSALYSFNAYWEPGIWESRGEGQP
jgi:hypothetical protein